MMETPSKSTNKC